MLLAVPGVLKATPGFGLEGEAAFALSFLGSKRRLRLKKKKEKEKGVGTRSLSLVTCSRTQSSSGASESLSLSVWLRPKNNAASSFRRREREREAIRLGSGARSLTKGWLRTNRHGGGLVRFGLVGRAMKFIHLR